MSEIKIEADYVNHKFTVLVDGEIVKTGLSVEIQEAIMKRVITDCETDLKRSLNSSLPDGPPGLDAMYPPLDDN